MKPGRRTVYLILILAAAAGAFALRLPLLDVRPLHTDEAVHGIKFGPLLEKGEFRYDPLEYHGPTLHYSTLIPAWLAGARTVDEVTVTQMRLVTVFFGLLLVALPFLARGALGNWGAAWAAFLTAVSPMMVYYSRYYIMEIMLVVFTGGLLLAIWHYWRRPSAAAAIAGGLCAGLMHATKETCVFAFAAAFGAVVLTWVVERASARLRQRGGAVAGSGEPKSTAQETPPETEGAHRAASTRTERAEARSTFPAGFKLSHLLWAGVAAAVVSMLFMSSFFTNPRGILDSVMTYAAYFQRAEGSGHEHPWNYYFQLLLYNRYGRGPIFSEAFILVLAVVGAVAAFRPPREGGFDPLAARFLLFYSVLLMSVYTVIPYKTPWLTMGCMHGFILLAGVGAASLFAWFRPWPVRAALAVVLAAGTWNLVQQCRIQNFKMHADPRNPYVYSHTRPDFLRLGQRLLDLAAIHPDGKAMLVKVMSAEYWPLPWYARSLTRVGYWNNTLPLDPEAPVIVVSPNLVEALDEALPDPDAYMVEFFGLRPGVALYVYIRRDLWDKFMETRK